MSFNIADLFKNYGFTGNPAIDALILSSLIPILISYATVVFNFVQNVITNIFYNKFQEMIYGFKTKYIGSVDFKLRVSQDKNIYTNIRSIFFSHNVESDNIDSHTISLLNIITENSYSGDNTYTYMYDTSSRNMYDLYMDSTNNIEIEKYKDMGSLVSKKYFMYENYYIIVSEKKKSDLMKMYSYYGNDKKDKTDESNVADKEYFIIFEAVRKTANTEKNDNILKNFLYERFKLNIRIPYKYIIKIANNAIVNKLNCCDSFKDFSSSQLSISDEISDFIANPKVAEFYGDSSNRNVFKIKNKQALASAMTANYNENVFNIENMNSGLILNDTSAISISNTFEPNARSIVSYFFGSRFEAKCIYWTFFYFKDNKIIIYVRYEKQGDVNTYLCVVSFQEILMKENLVNIFTELINSQTAKNLIKTDKKIRIYTYCDGEWDNMKCDARTTDTIFLPTITKDLVMSEMNKFMCFEKVFAENGIPYKKGFLFYGPPGTGKTSLVRALAYTYDIPIYIFDLNNGKINDENIASVINSISGVGNRFLLFEDISSSFADKEELKYQVRTDITVDATSQLETADKIGTKLDKRPINQKFLTYSGLLNAIDGVCSGNSGTIFIMTTNHIEKLGDALIRPGRIDLCVNLTFCDRTQIIDMTHSIITKSFNIINKCSKEILAKSNSAQKLTFVNNYDDNSLAVEIEKFADKIMRGEALSCVKPCELQVYILKYIENVKMIFENYQELLK